MSNRNRWVIVLGAAMGIASLAGCASPAGNERTAVEASSLIGTWAIDATFDSPEQPFVDFAEDNTWSASDGCNRVRGTWELGDEGALITTSGPQTMMACDGAQLPLAVTMASYVQVDGDALTIHSSKDSTVTDLVRSTDPLVGPQGLPIGYWVESADEGAPFLSISADGSYSGNDGCNVILGQWIVGDDEALKLTPGATTLMFCDGVDQWLSKAVLGRVLAGQMTLQDETGLVLGQLTIQQ